MILVVDNCSSTLRITQWILLNISDVIVQYHSDDNVLLNQSVDAVIDSQALGIH